MYTMQWKLKIVTIYGQEILMNPLWFDWIFAELLSFMLISFIIQLLLKMAFKISYVVHRGLFVDLCIVTFVYDSCLVILHIQCLLTLPFSHIDITWMLFMKVPMTYLWGILLSLVWVPRIFLNFARVLMMIGLLFRKRFIYRWCHILIGYDIWKVQLHRSWLSLW